jgi:hypothetical protein
MLVAVLFLGCICSRERERERERRGSTMVRKVQGQIISTNNWAGCYTLVTLSLTLLYRDCTVTPLIIGIVLSADSPLSLRQQTARVVQKPNYVLSQPM